MAPLSQHVAQPSSRPQTATRSKRLLFSPSCRYPNPAAYLVDDAGTILHTWSHPADQPRPADNPPRYLRGWNHIEADIAGNLFAIVPLRSLLKLTPASDLVWSCDIAAHHDLAIRDDGAVLVLTETHRRVHSDGLPHVVLDNLVTTVHPDGSVGNEYSLYDILRTNADLRGVIDELVRRRINEFRSSDWPAPGDPVSPATATETHELLRAGSFPGDRRRALELLRALPGKPCDVFHTNTLELVHRHPHGLWNDGDVLVCMREIDTVAVVDLDRSVVRWWWGPGHLSHPHQPSVLPDGRILVFDNGVKHKRTRLLAVEPCTGEVVWSWQADPPESFYCPRAGGCERLANGNLLVTNPSAGEAFELTMRGEIVWRLVLNPAVYGPDSDRDPDRVKIYRISAAEFDPGNAT